MKWILVVWICSCFDYLAGPVGACCDDTHHRRLRSADTTTDDDDTEFGRGLQWAEAMAAQDTSFTVGSYRWNNVTDFVKSGARCQTADLSATELELDRLAMAALRMSSPSANEAAEPRASNK